MRSGQFGVVTKRQLPWQLKPATQCIPSMTSSQVRLWRALHQNWHREASTQRRCEQLSTQLLGFEKHDDPVNALAYLILGVIGDGTEERRVHFI